MALNLIRNSRLFFTTNVDASSGVVSIADCDATNTFEIQVLDGFTFTQNTNADTITLSEAGPAPVRGQRSFNSSLAPVDFSFSTYVRPKLHKGSLDPEENLIADPEEKHLWNALASSTAVGGVGAGWDNTTGVLSFTNSNAHQLVKFGLIIQVDNATYVIDNAALNQAVVDFGIDAICTIAWTGQATGLRQYNGVTLTDGSTDVTFGGDDFGTSKATKKDVTAAYIANKLSTATVYPGINNTSTGAFTVPLTAGSITINNNITYLTPANLGAVNLPITYFTGTRAVSGTMTAYLRTGGTGDTGNLLASVLEDAATSPDNQYTIVIAMGGTTNANKMEFKMPAAMLQIPTVKAEAVMATDINFTAQGSASGAFDIAAANEITVTYSAAA